MGRSVILTCAVVGGESETLQQYPSLPKSPDEIANSALEAAEAGASIVHIHVRDPDTGELSNDATLYGEVVELIRRKNRDVIISLTSEMDAELYIEDTFPPKIGKDSTLKPVGMRVTHIAELKPDLATLHCGVHTCGDNISLYRISQARELASIMRRSGVKAHIQIFDFSHIAIANRLYREGYFHDPPYYQFGLLTGYGPRPEVLAISAMVNQLPEGTMWSAFGGGRHQMGTVAMAAVMGGHVRVGLEDNRYLRRGVLATNRELVENAVGIIDRIGHEIATPGEARELLAITS